MNRYEPGDKVEVNIRGGITGEAQWVAAVVTGATHPTDRCDDHQQVGLRRDQPRPRLEPRRDPTEGPMITPTICQVAVGMATTSLVLQLAAAIGRSRGNTPAADPVVITPTTPTPAERPSLKLSRMELLQHARALGVGNARWRNSAKKVDLVLAIRDHNEQRRAA